MKRYDLENYEDSLSIMDVATDGEWVDYHDAAEAIQQAHRDATEEVAKAHKRGWEQAKAEAVYIALKPFGPRIGDRDDYWQPKIADAIAAMEYKEPI